MDDIITAAGPLTDLKIIDLTLPARHGDGRFGQENDFTIPYTYKEYGWQAATFRMFAHFGTHVDAPLHFIENGPSIDEVPLPSLIGKGALFDLSDVSEQQGIDSELLVARNPGIQNGEIAILRTDWTDKNWGRDTFLTHAPYLTQEGAEWLLNQGVKSVVYDFPKERAIRQEQFGGNECVVHHIFLGNGVYNIEYVINLKELSPEKNYLIVAMPLKLVSLDGSPARVIAVEL